jgi:hypothetical protein
MVTKVDEVTEPHPTISIATSKSPGRNFDDYSSIDWQASFTFTILFFSVFQFFKNLVESY